MKQFAFCSRYFDLAGVIGDRSHGFGFRRLPARYIRAYRFNFGFGTVMLYLMPPR